MLKVWTAVFKIQELFSPDIYKQKGGDFDRLDIVSNFTLQGLKTFKPLGIGSLLNGHGIENQVLNERLWGKTMFVLVYVFSYIFPCFT